MKAAPLSTRPQRSGQVTPHSSTLILRRAEAALRLGNPTEAQRLALELIENDGTHVGGLEILAKARWNLNQHELLLETLSTLIRINPYEPGYHVLRGTSLRSLGRYGEALRSFVRAGDAEGAREAISELSALQSHLVLQLLECDLVFRAEYSHDPEKACVARGFEFGSETTIRLGLFANEYSRATLMQRPS